MNLPTLFPRSLGVVRAQSAYQLLSFQGRFPVREDLSDVTDEDTGPAQPPPPSKLPGAFRLKNDSDLFGLGLEEMGPKESSDEDRDSKLPSKEKKKKKKKSKEVPTLSLTSQLAKPSRLLECGI